ncbi:DUF1120 domain-containing protein [Achromobacter spanius]|uniref:DUF1120 domain-containing protein n=1 Tax=Achromobacter spanius TaxID=217203 RepID=UPI0038181FF0
MTLRYLSVAALAAVAIPAATTAQAQSIDVRVIGSITPAACSTTVSHGGVIDIKTIPAATLNVTSPTNLGGQMSLPFDITCAMPTQVAVRVFDNRTDSLITGITSGTPGSNGDASNFGLGAVGGQNIGGYTFNFVDTLVRLAEGGLLPAYVISSGDGGQSWTSVGSGSSGAAQKGASNLLSWSETRDGPPAAITMITGHISPNVTIAKAADLPLKDEIPLDGSATVELVYL